MPYIDEEVDEHMFSINETRKTSVFLLEKCFHINLYTTSSFQRSLKSLMENIDVVQEESILHHLSSSKKD